MPQGVEILLTPAYALAGQPGAQMVLPGFFVFALLMAYAVARRCGIGGMPAIAGSLIAGAIPFLHWSGSIFKNDLALALFLLGSLYCYLCSRESDNPNWLRLGAFLLAMAFGVKHVAIFGGIPLGLLYVYALWRRPRRGRRAAEVAVIVVVLGLVWQVRAFLLIGNPFHPYSVETAVEKWQPMEGSGRPSTFLLYAQYPWIVHFEGRRSFENPSSNPAGIFLVLFWPLWLFWRRKSGDRGERACLLFTAVYYLYWGYIWGVLRYFIVPFLLLVLFTAARLFAFYEHAGRIARGTIQAALAYSLLFAVLVTVPIEANPPQLRFLAGKLGREAYLREAIAGFRSLEYLAGRVQPDERILAVGNCFRAYAPATASYDCIDGQPLARAGKKLQRRLRANRYAFLIVPAVWREELMPPPSGGFEAKTEYSDEAFVVYSLHPRAVQAGGT
jgi:4-amino-4-deoxy-L-arabinose transferase-like glycosyltransferase